MTTPVMKAEEPMDKNAAFDAMLRGENPFAAHLSGEMSRLLTDMCREYNELRAAITEREERIAALRALVDHHESEANERFTVEGNKKWKRRLAELRAAAGRLPNGEWKP